MRVAFALVLGLAPAAKVAAAATPIAALTEHPAGAPAAKSKVVAPPKTPPGLPACTKPLTPASDLPRASGETIRYHVDVDGLSIGIIDFKIERKGLYEGRAVTEYRSLFKLDGLVSTFLPVEGQAAALVPEATFAPARAMNRYKLSETQFEENQTFSTDGRKVESKRTRDGKLSDERREFPSPATDFVSGFYLLRRLPAGAEGCTIIYGNQRAYTIWIKPDGTEKVKTPVGLREADRYAITYASDKSKKILTARLWLGDAPERLPYRAEITGNNKIEARIHLYENGK
jgi:hypothetical protein